MNSKNILHLATLMALMALTGACTPDAIDPGTDPDGQVSLEGMAPETPVSIRTTVQAFGSNSNVTRITDTDLAKIPAWNEITEETEIKESDFSAILYLPGASDPGNRGLYPDGNITINGLSEAKFKAEEGDPFNLRLYHFNLNGKNANGTAQPHSRLAIMEISNENREDQLLAITPLAPASGSSTPCFNLQLRHASAKLSILVETTTGDKLDMNSSSGILTEAYVSTRLRWAYSVYTGGNPTNGSNGNPTYPDLYNYLTIAGTDNLYPDDPTNLEEQTEVVICTNKRPYREFSLTHPDVADAPINLLNAIVPVSATHAEEKAGEDEEGYEIYSYTLLNADGIPEYYNTSTTKEDKDKDVLVLKLNDIVPSTDGSNTAASNIYRLKLSSIVLTGLSADDPRRGKNADGSTNNNAAPGTGHLLFLRPGEHLTLTVTVDRNRIVSATGTIDGWSNATADEDLTKIDEVDIDANGIYNYKVKNARTLQAIVNWMRNGGTPPLLPAGTNDEVPHWTRMATNITLTDDITLTDPATADGSNWMPLGEPNSYYTGTFDGGGHQISNLVIRTPGYNSKSGLFTQLEQYSTVKNLILKDAVIETNDRNTCCGSIAGTNYGTIKNCHFVTSGTEGKGRITMNTGGLYGGIAGENMSYGTIIACSYDGVFINNKGNASIGSIVGINKNSDPSTILGCYSTAENVNVAGSVALGASLPQGCFPAYNTKFGSIADLNNNVHLLNATIYGNNNRGKANEDKFPFHYVAGGDGNTPPVLTAGAPELESDLGGIKIQDDVWQISTHEDLMTFAYVASTGGNNAKLNAKLTTDIALPEPIDAADGSNANGNGSNWTPIAGTKAEPYIGTFDGGGYKIKNLVMRTAAADVNNALFAYIGTSGMVKNLTLEDAEIVSTYVDYSTYCAGIAVENRGIIANCHFVATGVKGKGVVTSKSCYNNAAAGIARSNYGTIIGCSNSGTITGAPGGTASTTAGIVQSNSGGTIVGCSNSGTVTGCDAHGIAGYDSPYSSSQFIACYTTAEGSNIASTSLDRIKGCYPPCNSAFGSEGSAADGTNKSSIEDMNQSYIGHMNLAIYAYNEGIGMAAEKKFPYQYTIGSGSNLPTMKNEAPTYQSAISQFSVSITPGTGGSSDTWQISTLKDLQAFAAVVNLGGDYAKLNATLTDNITMPSNSSSWTPMKNYAGCFDGKGYSIQGLNINGREGDFGFFVNITEYGSVKDLTLVDAIINASSGSAAVGGIAVRNRGTITNCNISGSLNNDKGKCGGIVAENVGIIMTCTNSSTVTNNNDNCGGIAGDNTGSIIACTNSGTITRKDRTDYVGGITGYSSGDIIACTNSGIVNNSTDGAGGVVGYNNTGNTRNVISCYTITQKSRVLNTNSNGSSPAINCYPPNDDEGKQNNFDDSQYTITGLNSYVSTLNEGITGWNKDKQTTDAKYCNYHFDAGSSSDSTPPKLVEGAPE